MRIEGTITYFQTVILPFIVVSQSNKGGRTKVIRWTQVLTSLSVLP